MSEALSNTVTFLAMGHHDLQKCTWQNQGGPGCKEESPPPQWLLTTVCQKQQNRGRRELKEENLAPLRLTIFFKYFYCLVWLRYKFTQVKVQLGSYSEVYDASMVHYGGGTNQLSRY